MDATKHYEDYWGRKNKDEDFYSYERNWVLENIFKKGEKLLDVGCGDGSVGEFFVNLGVKVYGIDLSQKAVKSAKRKGVKARVGSVESALPYANSTFDSVFWGDNIEHLFDPAKTLKEIHRVLKKKGKLVLSCPNMGYWRYRLHYFINGKLPDTEWSGNPPWYWSHIRFFNIAILTKLLRLNGFKVASVSGVNKRFPDRLFATKLPGLFGMILVVEAIKK